MVYLLKDSGAHPAVHHTLSFKIKRLFRNICVDILYALNTEMERLSLMMTATVVKEDLAAPSH